MTTTVEISETFGRRNYGSGAHVSMAHDKMVSKFTLTKKAEVGKLTVYGIGGAAGPKIKGIIYSISAGNPVALLGVSEEATVTSTSAIKTDLTFAARITLEAGEYGLGIHHKTVGGETFHYVKETVTNGAAGATDDYNNGTEVAFGAITWVNNEICIYATYYLTKTVGTMVTGHTVATVTTNRALRWQEKLCFAADRIWIVYVDASKAYLTSSADNGVTWSTPLDLGRGLVENLGENLQILANEDGTNRIHIFTREWSPTPAMVSVFYRSGIANSDGTITWTAAWVEAWMALTGPIYDFFAALDSEGYPYLTMCFGNIPYVNKSTTNNGIWTTASGYPLALAGTSYQNNFIVALSNRRMYAFYFTARNDGNYLLYGRYWSGFSWGAQETVSARGILVQYIVGFESWSRGVVVDEDDNIHLVFLEYGGNRVFDGSAYVYPFSFDVVYIKRDLTTGWGSEVTVQADIPFENACPAVTLNEGFVRIFWLNDPENFISYKRIDDEDHLSKHVYLVDETTDTFDGSTTGYGYDGLLNPFVKLVESKFAMLWETKTSTPGTYAIKFGLQNFSYEYKTQDTRKFDTFKLKLKKSGVIASFDVTRLALTLGDRDTTTGQYATDYDISMIEMVILEKDNQRVALELGYFVTQDALGYTTDLVRIYDRIQDNVGRTWQAQTATPVLRGNVFYYYVVNLKEMVLYVE